MTTYTYKGYTINQIGLSHYIYRPNNPAPSLKSRELNYNCDRIEGSQSAAKRWINQDIADKEEVRLSNLEEENSRIEAIREFRMEFRR